MKRSLVFLCFWLAVLGIAPSYARPEAPDLDRLVQSLDPYIESSRQAWQVPGLAVALVADGKMVWSQGYGVRALGGNQPVTSKTIFQIGSISKSFTSALVAMQVDRGALNWNDRVVDHFPEFRMHDAWVTRECRIDDTMSQRSGMAPYVGDLMAFLGKDRRSILAAMRSIVPVSSFRSEFAYVNNMWLVTAAVLESVTGFTWEQLIERDIFQPLGMTSSSTDRSGLFSAENHASGHRWNGRGMELLADDWPHYDWTYIYGPAGGINSNVEDMARYLAMQMGQTPQLSAASRDRLHQPHTRIQGSQTVSGTEVVVEATSYCLGWLRQERTPYPLVWHNGGTSGFRTVAGFVPQANFGIVVLSNTADSNLAEAIMMRAYDLYFGLPEVDYSAQSLLAWKASRPKPDQRPKNPTPPASLERYLGNYQHPTYGSAQVVRRGQGLLLTVDGRLKLELSPWNGDVFACRDADGGSDEKTEYVTFLPEPDGSYSGFRATMLEDIAEGLFTRAPR